VSTSDLAPKILAFTFMHLRDEGAIALQAASKKVLFVTTNWIDAHRTGSPTATTGAAAALYNRIGDGVSVKDAVYAWYPGDYANPWPLPIQTATKEAVEAGFLQTVQQGVGGKLGSMFTGAMPTTIVSGKEADVRAIADDAAKKWQAYQAQDSGFLDLLVKQCAGGISLHTEQTSTPDV
jgi:hypothetical protein